LRGPLGTGLGLHRDDPGFSSAMSSRRSGSRSHPAIRCKRIGSFSPSASAGVLFCQARTKKNKRKKNMEGGTRRLLPLFAYAFGELATLVHRVRRDRPDVKDCHLHVVDGGAIISPGTVLVSLFPSSTFLPRLSDNIIEG